MSSVGEWQVIGKVYDQLGESPLWHPVEQALYWIDFYGPIIHRFDPATRDFQDWHLTGARTIGSIASEATLKIRSAW